MPSTLWTALIHLAAVAAGADATSPPVPALSPLLAGDDGRPIADAAGWGARREKIRAAWLDYLGRYPEDRGPVSLETISEDRPDGCIRRLVRYEVEPGIRVEAYLLLPAGAKGPAPGVVVLHPTTDATIREPAGLAADPPRHFALSLARRGVAAIAPPCFLWAEREPGKDYRDAVKAAAARHPGTKGMAKMLHDARRAVDVLAGLPGVDAGRIGCIGHSLGGKEALYLAAFDGRVKAAVSCEGGIGISFSNWDAPWYLGPEAGAPGFPLEHHQVLALVPPRAFLLLAGGGRSGADGARSLPFIDAVLPVYDVLGVPRRADVFLHGRGHAVPAEASEAALAWLERALRGE